MSASTKHWLHVRLEIILEQAQAIRDLANRSGDPKLFPIVENIRRVVQDSCRKANLGAKGANPNKD